MSGTHHLQIQGPVPTASPDRLDVIDLQKPSASTSFPSRRILIEPEADTGLTADLEAEFTFEVKLGFDLKFGREFKPEPAPKA